MWGKPVVAEASMTLHQPEVAVCSPGEVVPGLWDPGSGGLHRLPGGELWLVTCACTPASSWLQQQPQRLMPISGVCANSCGLYPSLELV